mmetsp:Transcript_9847/g.14891  ORF Transcript_9847/g.14891 Transcript_9847/m.14891 type:complete len:94 (+) Transcript_9847:137-418(+)
MASSTPKADKTTTTTDKKEKNVVMVPRKELQSVPDLLMNGPKEASPTESMISKAIWMFFLVVMFYVSFEIFMYAHRVDNGGGDDGQGSNKSEL